MTLTTHYERQNGMVVFENGVEISDTDLDALFKLKAQVTCMPSFIWSQLLRLEESDSELIIHFLKTNFRRKAKALEVLRDSEHFRMETEEVRVNGKTKIRLSLSDITPEFKSIIPLV